MYVVNSLDRVFWKFAKGEMSYTDFTDLKNQLTTEIQDFLQYTDIEVTEKTLAQLLSTTYGDMCANILVPRHISEIVFKSMYGDPVIEAVYGPDNRTINEKIIVGILTALRLTQIKKDNKILVDFGQYEDQ